MMVRALGNVFKVKKQVPCMLANTSKELWADVPAKHQGVGNYSLHLYVTEQCPEKSKLHTLSNVRSVVWCGVV